MSRSLLAVVVAALAAVAPAAAWAQAGPTPTLAFDQSCYSPGDQMVFSGTGYTPGGEVNFVFAANGRFGSYQTQVDPSGAIGGSINSPDPEDFIDDDDFATEMFATANDRTRIDAGAPPDQQFAPASFTYSRYEVEIEQPNGSRVKSGKPMRVTAVGFTNARGKVLYAHYRRGNRTLKTIRLGRLAGACGNRTKTLPRALPRGLRPGRYKLVFNTSVKDPNASPLYWHNVRFR